MLIIIFSQIVFIIVNYTSRIRQARISQTVAVQRVHSLHNFRYACEQYANTLDVLSLDINK